MRYVLGSESEEMQFSSGVIEYRPCGLRHAVDTAAPDYQADRAVGYALCGRAVRAWSGIAFDDKVAGAAAHDECVALAAQPRRHEAVAAKQVAAKQVAAKQVAAKRVAAKQ